jgi:hypothetical protein
VIVAVTVAMTVTIALPVALPIALAIPRARLFVLAGGPGRRRWFR